MVQVARAEDEATRAALAAALALLAGTAGAAVVAVLILRLHPSLYLPFVMPAVIGWAVGTAVAAVRARRPEIGGLRAAGVAVFCALAAYATYHLLVYVRIMELLVSELPSIVDRLASDPTGEVQRWLEESTGHQGLLAYLSFVSTGRGAEISPLGALGALEPGPWGTLAAVAIEAVESCAAAVLFVRLRTGPLGIDGGGPPVRRRPRVRDVVARTDQATIQAAMEALERGDHEAAGRSLSSWKVDGSFTVALLHDPYTTDSYTLEILERAASGDDVLRLRRELTSWQGQALWDELRLGRGGGHSTEQAATSSGRTTRS